MGSLAGHLNCYTTTLLQLHVSMQTHCNAQCTSQAACTDTWAAIANSGSKSKAANQPTTHGLQGPYKKKKQTLADDSQSDGNKENEEEVSESVHSSK